MVADTMTTMNGRDRWVSAYVLAHIAPVLASTCVWIIVCALQPLAVVVGPALGIVAVLVRNQPWALRLRTHVGPTTAHRDGSLATQRPGAPTIRAIVTVYCLPWRAATAVGSSILNVTGLRPVWEVLWALRPIVLVVAIAQAAASGSWGLAAAMVVCGVLTYAGRGAPSPKVS